MITIRKSVLSFVLGGILMLGGQSVAMAQEDQSHSDTTKQLDKVYVVVEEEPKLIGGLDTLQQMINYPDSAEKAGIQGRVFLQFVVTKEGKVHNPEILRGVGGGLDREALRVIKKARFKPGKQQGEPVNVRYTMPIVFKL